MTTCAAVYGPPKALPVTEEHVPEPSSPYGLEKLAVEHYCRVFAELHDRISDLMGVPRDRECMAFPNGNVMDSQGDNRRIRAELGFTVGVGLDEGLENTVEWAQRRYR